jgi:exodeoxyribonuclease-3
MRIATWNVNGLRARLEFVLHWLRERQPDVVGLQEIKVEEPQFPHAEIAALGYHTVIHGQKSWNGVALLSRTPATPVTLGLPGQEDFGARLVTADIGGIRVSSVYCPNGKSLSHPDFPRKLAWFDSLAEHLEAERSALPTIVGGDFNVCPAAIDSWNEAGFTGDIFHTDDERRRFRRLLDAGYVDVFRRLHPDDNAFSWWDYRGGAFHKKQGLRIDFLLANEAAAARVKSVEIDREYRKKKGELTPSDHAPVILDLDV